MRRLRSVLYAMSYFVLLTLRARKPSHRHTSLGRHVRRRREGRSIGPLQPVDALWSGLDLLVLVAGSADWGCERSQQERVSWKA